MSRTGPLDDDWQAIGAPVLAAIPHDPQLGSGPISPRLNFGYRRRLVAPLILFLVTCASTYYAGHKFLDATGRIGPLDRSGLTYMGLVMAILLAHELGHFVPAVLYRVPASLPYFIPMPITPLGTMGAVIFMPSLRDRIARLIGFDRCKIFDISLAGPLLGLVVAVPVLCLGILGADLVPMREAGGPVGLRFGEPLLLQWLAAWLRPDLRPDLAMEMNPACMAGWVGMFVTGLNMLPVSQLDGGHVAYALLGRRAHLLARGIILAALAYIILNDQYGWLVMLTLVMAIGTDHPPTVDDRAPLGTFRIFLGWASLLIPVLCLTPVPIAAG